MSTFSQGKGSVIQTMIVCIALMGYSLFRNDAIPWANSVRPFGAMTVYCCIDYYPGYPYSCNSDGVQITTIRLITTPHLYNFWIISLT